MLDPSATDLRLVIVFQLGVCILLLAGVVNGTQGYETTLGLVGKLVGGVMIVGTAGIVLPRWRFRTGG